MSAAEHLSPSQFGLKTVDYEGQVGNPSHVTRVQTGHLPTSAVEYLKGARGEEPGGHRNRSGQEWERFKNDILTNGIKEPVFITVDHGEDPVLSEGNHRRDAAVELGLRHVPVEVRYYGHAEKTHKGWAC